MPNKPIIEIQVDASKFDAFLKQFEEYEEALKSQPKAWDSANEAMGAGKDAVLAMTAAMLAQTESLHKLIADSRHLEKTTVSTASAMGKVAASAKSIAGHIAHATVSLMKWTSIGGALSGLAGIGGLFGLERLASSASSLRSRAMGYAVAPGALQALGINFGPFVDVPGALSRTVQAQQDITKRWIFSGMGIPGAATATPDVALEQEMAAARRLYRQTPAAYRQQVMAQRGFTDIFSMEEIRRLGGMSRAEFQRHVAAVARDERALAYPPDVMQAWQRLLQQLDRASTEIENAFITALAPLTPELRKLSAAFVGVVNAFLQSPALKKWIDDIAVALKQFADYVGTPEFRKNVQSFAADLETITRGLARAVKWIASWFPGAAPSAAPSAKPTTTTSWQQRDAAKLDEMYKAHMAWLQKHPGGTVSQFEAEYFPSHPDTAAIVADMRAHPAKWASVKKYMFGTPSPAAPGGAPSSMVPGGALRPAAHGGTLASPASGTLDRTQTAFLNALAVGESHGDYHILYGGRKFSSFAHFPVWAGIRTRFGMTHAAGRYQFEPKTWAEERRRLGLPDFGERSQDLAAWDLAARTYRRRTGRDLERDLQAGGHEAQIAAALHSTWTSLSARNFPRRFHAALAALAPTHKHTPSAATSTLTTGGALKKATHPLAARIQPQQGTKVTIDNRTGGSAIITASNLAY